ncbi:MAG: NAD-dependent epimerase/dehydratase family protein [Candidatus Aenigmarchaeota archaeon]|nr:NAD-dependent epimerase/dehydratase family protein [Pseudomonadota bacterium]NIO23227.1 NAD-dependent epimerase/dehydratase family protein [Candidatus Aenigmarchaeota archaeon]NIQ18104.1 NAD-dependent epimerase/dehydratase family protein [Candidatus Aenigmarchaeota archaeon]
MKRMRSKVILVTGGAGFIGSHLIDRLIEKNRVICVDNLSTGSCKNIEHLMDNKNFLFIEHDVKKPLKLDEKVDEIYHLASRASPIDFEKFPVDILLTNSLGTYNMLELARRDRAKFLFASTSEVYGDPEKHPQSENYWGNVNSIGMRSCYDESKRFGESLVSSYQRKFKLSTKIARIFNTYGSRMRADDGRVIPNFITQSLNNENVTIYGEGKQTRSFCHVNDMVDGLTKLMSSKSAGPVNIGNPSEIKILDLAKLIKRMTDSKSEIVFERMPENDPLRRKPDIEKARKELNWKPLTDLEPGLKITIDWFRKSC